MATLERYHRQLNRLVQSAAKLPAASDASMLDVLRDDPAQTMLLAGVEPDPWQAELLRLRPPSVLLCCSRQAGKSSCAAAVALHEALVYPGSLVLLVARAQRQAQELFTKLLATYRILGRPVPKADDRASELNLTNGSRIVPLPGKEETLRSYSSVNLLVMDEAARIPDALYYSLRPMLAVSRGRLVALSTPFGRRGWFHTEFTGDDPTWYRVRIKATECPRIDPEFLAEEKRKMGPRWFNQEFMTSFEDAVGQVFADEYIQATLTPNITQLF